MKKIIIYFIMLLSIPANAFATALILQDAIKQATEYSPDIKSIEEQIKTAEAQKRQAFAPSDPTASVSYNDTGSLFSPGTAASTVYQVSQPVAFPGKAFVNHNVANAQVKALKEQSKAMRLQVASNVKQAYYQLSLARKNLELHKELQEDYKEILAIAKRRYEAGSITQVDYLNAQVTLYSDLNSVKDLESAENNARVQLNILIGGHPEDAVDVADLHFENKPPVEKGEAIEKMMANRAEIAASRAQLEGTEYSYTLAKMSLLPDFQLIGGTTNYNIPGATPLSNTSGHNKTYTVGLQMTIPLWAPVNERETINAAEHNKVAAEDNLRSLIDQSRNNLSMTIDSIHALTTKLENYEKHLLPLSERSFKLALTNYSIGKIDFQALSDTAIAKRSMQSDYNTAIANYLTAYSTYGQFIGKDL